MESIQKRKKISTRKFVFLIVESSLFLLLFISLFLPQLSLVDLNGNYNIFQLGFGGKINGYKVFNESAPLILMTVFVAIALILSVDRIFEKGNKVDNIYSACYAVIGLLTGVFSLTKKSFISFTTLEDSMISSASLLWGTYVTCILGFAIMILAIVDIILSHREK